MLIDIIVLLVAIAYFALIYYRLIYVQILGRKTWLWLWGFVMILSVILLIIH